MTRARFAFALGAIVALAGTAASRPSGGAATTAGSAPTAEPAGRPPRACRTDDADVPAMTARPPRRLRGGAGDQLAHGARPGSPTPTARGAASVAGATPSRSTRDAATRQAGPRRGDDDLLVGVEALVGRERPSGPPRSPDRRRPGRAGRPAPPSDDASRPSSSDPAGTRSRANRITRWSPTGTVATTSEPMAAAAKAGAARCDTLRVKRMPKPCWTRTANSGSNSRTHDPQVGPDGARVERDGQVDQVVAGGRDERPRGAEVEFVEDLADAARRR